MHHHHKSGPGLVRQRIEQMLQCLDPACRGSDADHDRPRVVRSYLEGFFLTQFLHGHHF
jgi:hypothetical protein